MRSGKGRLIGVRFDLLFDLLCVLALGTAFCAVSGTLERAAASDEIGSAPSFILDTPDGSIHSDSLRGKTVLLDFWASWCEPCRRSFPWLGMMQKQYGAGGLVVLAVDLDKKRELADAFLQKIPAPFLVAFDPSGKTAEAYKVRAMPTTFLISPEGKILHAQAGFQAKGDEALEALIRKGCTP